MKLRIDDLLSTALFIYLSIMLRIELKSSSNMIGAVPIISRPCCFCKRILLSTQKESVTLDRHALNVKTFKDEYYAL